MSDLAFDVSGFKFNPKRKKSETNKTLPADLNLKSKPGSSENFDNLKTLQKELQDKKEEIKTLKSNFKDKVALMEQENKKNIESIEAKYSELIQQINKNCEHKISEIKEQYNKNISKINQQYLDILNEILNLRANTISLSTHYAKINEINGNYEKKIKEMKDEFDNKLRQISLKLNDNFSLENYNVEQIKNPDDLEMIKFISKIKLQQKIGYYTYILDLQKKYEEMQKELKGENIDKLENLKQYTIKKFDSLIGITEQSSNTNTNHGSNKNENFFLTNNLTNNNNTIEARKKSEIVNYDTTKLNIPIGNKNPVSARRNNYDIDSNNNMVSKNQDKFSSGFSSFNFNEDSIPNREIQVLSPPEVIQ